MSESIVSLHERLSNMSYNDIRREAKLYSISARGKKVKLIEKIVEAAKNAKANLEKKYEMKQIENFNQANDNEDQNTTFTIEMEDAYQPNDVLVDHLSDDNGLGDAENVENLSSARKPRSFSKNSLLFTNEEAEAEPITTIGKKSICNELLNTFIKIPTLKKSDSKEAAKSSYPVHNRFELKHKALFDKMLSISDADVQLKKRIENNKCNISERIQKLAMPKQRCNKSAERNIPIFDPSIDPKKLSFKFGNVPVKNIASVQRPFSANRSSVKCPGEPRGPLKLSRSFCEKTKMDVKGLTKRISSKQISSELGLKRNMSLGHAASRPSVTVPVMTPRLEQLSTPKHFDGILKARSSVCSHSSGTPKYRPYTGAYRYVDTTKMDNKMLADFKAKLKN